MTSQVRFRGTSHLLHRRPRRESYGAAKILFGHPLLPSLPATIEAWLAAATEGVEIQMRKGYVSLLGPRRKFAQVTRTTNRAVDVSLRLDAAAHGRLEALKARPDDPFDRRDRLTSVDQVDGELLDILAAALDQNT